MNVMKIAFFVAEYQRAAGSQRSLLSMIKNLPSKHEVVVIFPADGPCPVFYRHEQVPSVILKAPAALNIFQKQLLRTGFIKKMVLFLRYVVPYSVQVHRFLRKNEIKILHCNSPRALLLSAVVPKLMGIKIVLHIRGNGSETGGVLSLLSRLIADKIILVAEQLKQNISTRILPKIHVVYNSIGDMELPERKFEYGNRGFERENAIFLMLASVVPFKSYHHVLEAMRIVQERKGKVILYAAGDVVDQEYYQYIKGLIADYGLEEAFSFLGWVESPGKLYRSAEAIVMPSVEKGEIKIKGKTISFTGNEGLPRVILEGMAFAKPVIATKVAGVPEQVVHMETGIMVPPGDPEALAEAMLFLSRDRERRISMGRKGYERYREKFSPEVTASQVEKVYQGLLNVRGKGGVSR